MINNPLNHSNLFSKYFLNIIIKNNDFDQDVIFYYTEELFAELSKTFGAISEKLTKFI